MLNRRLQKSYKAQNNSEGTPQEAFIATTANAAREDGDAAGDAGTGGSGPASTEGLFFEDRHPDPTLLSARRGPGGGVGDAAAAAAAAGAGPASMQSTPTPAKTPKRADKRRRVSKGSVSRSSSKAREDPPIADGVNEVVSYRAPRPTARYSDLGGADSALQDVREVIEVMFTHIELFIHLGTQPPHGVLLHGPPGCGKTLLAHAIAGELDVPFYKVSAPALVGSASGDSERSIRSLFEQATHECRRSTHGCLIFIDEIDVIAPKRESAQREMERRIVAQLLSCMDELTLDNCGGKPVLVIGATNRPDSLDAAMRRAGRFDREVGMTVPDAAARKSILTVLCGKLRVDGDFDFTELAARTPGYVGADFVSLVNEASLLAVSRAFGGLLALPDERGASAAADSAALVVAPAPGAVGTTAGLDAATAAPSGAPAPDSVMSHADSVPPTGPPLSEQSDDVSARGSLSWRTGASDAIRQRVAPFSVEQLAGLFVTRADFEAALPRVQPSAKREGFATIPEVSWADVGALGGPRQELEDAIVLPLKHPEMCREVGIPRPPGVLLYGPPGCGKTLLAKAVANGTHANFISVKGPELLNKFVGESERAVRQVFLRARTSAPCIIFFDELDALCPVRDNDSGSRNTQRLVNQLLTEMDGFDADPTKQVFVIAATNRPDIIDPAMLRPGRLDKLVYVDVPGPEGRVAILRTQTRRVTLAADVDLAELAADGMTFGYTGADLAALVREAGTLALRRLAKLADGDLGSITSPSISAADLVGALDKVAPSVSVRDLARYRGMKRKLRGSRGAVSEKKTAMPPSSE
jgi:ribosome biogenesis ATPase